MSVLLEAHELTHRRAGRLVVDAVSMQLHTGELLGIVGPNGAGKSSLLRLLAGLETADSGSITLDDVALSAMPARTRAQVLGFHAQNPELHWPLTVSTVLALSRLPYVRTLAALAETDRAAIMHAVRETDLHDLLERRADELSGGEQARMHLARLLAGQHRILLADEPIANLDPRYQLEILDGLKRHAASAGAVIVILHDLALAARYCDRLLIMSDARVHSCGTPRTVCTPATIGAVFQVDEDYFQLSGLAGALR